MGPVRVKLPTGALYYGGLVALAAGGAVELPLAAGLAVAGLVVRRRWPFRSWPTVTVYDSEPESAPQRRVKR
jgi:hypothetical protein